MILTDVEPLTSLLAGFWTGSLRAREGFTVQLVLPEPLPARGFAPAFEAWRAAVAAVSGRGGVLVLAGSARLLPVDVERQLEALRATGHALLVVLDSGDGNKGLTPKHQHEIIVRIKQYDSGEAGKKPGRRFSLTVDGQTTYLFVTNAAFDPKQTSFEKSKEHWVWPAGNAWTAPFTLDPTDFFSPASDNDLPEKHAHGELTKVPNLLPEATDGECRFLYKGGGTDHVVIFKKPGSAPRYYASPNLVVEEFGHLKLAAMTFVIDDEIKLTKGTWWAYPPPNP